jgi:hypothetical protein
LFLSKYWFKNYNGTSTGINSTSIDCNSITLYFPASVYRIASKIRLSPALSIIGDGDGNTYQARDEPSSSASFPRLNTVFKVDYAGTTDYAFDVSPYNAVGTRLDNAFASSTSLFTASEGIKIQNIL